MFKYSKEEMLRFILCVVKSHVGNHLAKLFRDILVEMIY